MNLHPLPGRRPLPGPTDLIAFWAALVESEPLRRRSVWLLFLDAERCTTGPFVSLDDLPDGPYALDPEAIAAWCADLIEGPGDAASVAILMTRPEGTPWTVSDRAWGRFLLRVAQSLPGERHPVYRAHRWCLEEFVLPAA